MKIEILATKVPIKPLYTRHIVAIPTTKHGSTNDKGSNVARDFKANLFSLVPQMAVDRVCSINNMATRNKYS